MDYLLERAEENARRWDMRVMAHDIEVAVEGRFLFAKVEHQDFARGGHHIWQQLVFIDKDMPDWVNIVEYVDDENWDGTGTDFWDTSSIPLHQVRWPDERYRIPRSAHQMSPAGHSTMAYRRIFYGGYWTRQNIDGETLICVDTSTDESRVLPLWVKLNECLKG